MTWPERRVRFRGPVPYIFALSHDEVSRGEDKGGGPKPDLVPIGVGQRLCLARDGREVPAKAGA